VRILVVEDESRVRSFVRRGLVEAGMAVDLAEDGEQALALARSVSYDAIVLDLGLPDRDGLEVLREIRARGCPAPVLVLTARDAVEDRVRGLDGGADDFLVKPFNFDELVARVRALGRRTGADTGAVLEVADLRLDPRSRRVDRGGQELTLTAKEFALLEYLVRHAGEVVTRTMIAEHVWNLDFDSFSNVIDVYIRYLRRKIDDPFETKLIHTRRGIGYVLQPRP